MFPSNLDVEIEIEIEIEIIGKQSKLFLSGPELFMCLLTSKNEHNLTSNGERGAGTRGESETNEKMETIPGSIF